MTVQEAANKPLYCPSCGTPTRLERADNPLSGKFKAHQALDCGICGVMYQLASQTDILRAATASGGDMLEYFMDDDGVCCPRKCPRYNHELLVNYLLENCSFCRI